jgi:hypothetical protein
MSEETGTAEQLAEPTPEPLSEDPWGDGEAQEAAPAPDPTPEPAPEPVAEPVAVDPPADPEAEEKPEKTVPYAAMHEERMMRKEAAQEAADAREKMARMEERFQMIQERMAAPEPEPADFDDDPAEYLNETLQKTQAELAEVKQRLEGQDEQSEANQRFNNMMGNYKTAVQTYSSETPEFQDAYNYAFSGRVQEYMAAGYDEKTSTSIAQQDEVAIVQKAFADGVNPAERIHALAKARGFTAAPKPAGAEEKLAAIEKGQEAAKNLGGAAPPPELTLEALADMDDEDFAANWDKAMGVKNTSIYG